MWFSLLDFPGPMVSSGPSWIGFSEVHLILSYCLLVPTKSPYFHDYRAVDYSTIWIRWERLLPKYAGGILRGYRIYYIPHSNYEDCGFVRTITVGPDVLEMTITELQPTTYYRVWVKAFTSKGEGGGEKSAYFRTSKSFFRSS